MRHDPLLPATLRFPLQPLTFPPSDDPPSRGRPFALRFTVVAAEPAMMKHRTIARPTRVPQKIGMQRQRSMGMDRRGPSPSRRPSYRR